MVSPQTGLVLKGAWLEIPMWFISQGRVNAEGRNRDAVIVKYLEIGVQYTLSQAGNPGRASVPVACWFLL